MSDEKALEAVHYMITSIYDTLFKMKDDKPEIFDDPEFSKYCIMAAVNLVCQLARAGQIDIKTLQTNIDITWKEMTKSKSKPPKVFN